MALTSVYYDLQILNLLNITIPVVCMMAEIFKKNLNPWGRLIIVLDLKSPPEVSVGMFVAKTYAKMGGFISLELCLL